MANPDPSGFLAQLQALANGGGGITPYSGAGSTAGKDPYANYLWLGGREQGRYSPGRDAVIPSASLKGALSSSAELLPYKWLTEDKKKLVAMYAKASKVTGTPITNFQDFNKVWAQALQISQGSWAATQGGKTGSPLTPYDALDLMGREASANGPIGPHSVTTHSTSVNKLSDGDTWAVLQDAASKALGRAPTHSELRSFAAHANDIAVRNPTRTTTTTRYGADGSVTGSRSTTKQGADAADYQLAAQNATATPEAGAFQAASTYYDALVRGLNSVV